MIFGVGKPDEEIRLLQSSHNKTAIFPLAVPSIASPGAMLAAVLLTKSSVFSVWEQAQTALVMLDVLVLGYILLLAGFIHRIVGSYGASVISRMKRLILSSIAITNLMAELSDYAKVS